MSNGVMAFYASGSISAYKNLRKIVDSCFSDPTRRPFVSLMKTRGEVLINNIDFCGAKQDTKPAEHNDRAQTTEPAPFADLPDEDLPF